MRPIKKILIHKKTGKKFYVKDTDNFHTQYGVVKSKDITASKKVIKSEKGDEFIALPPHFVDLWESMQRGPQVMIQKDIGLIIARTGVNQTSSVVDAGGGSGSLCLALANVCKEVTCYEINPEHYKVVTKNIEAFAMKNITLKQENIYQGIEEKNVDLVTLDLPEPWQVTEHAQESLGVGGFLVVYLPNLGQVKLFIDSLRGTELKWLETVELLERKWKITEKIMRPEFDMLGHTGFLTFCRRL
jgi:tRNA (adenine57-N1/adenine58-N1)-methyltransferase catalytic subunit